MTKNKIQKNCQISQKNTKKNLQKGLVYFKKNKLKYTIFFTDFAKTSKKNGLKLKKRPVKIFSSAHICD